MTELAEVHDLVDLEHLSAPERAARARQAWRDSGGGLSADQLAERYDRSPRWARQQIAAARQEDSVVAATEVPAAASHVPSAATPESDGSPVAAERHEPAAERLPAAGVAVPVLPPRQAPAGTRLPAAFRIVTLGSVAVVAAVCAAASYTHLHDLVAAAGGGWLAWVLPLGIDGAVTAGSVTLVAHHRYGGPRRTRVFATVAVAIGLVASVAANVAAVDPTLVDVRHVRWVTAGYPPVVLALVVDLAFSMLRSDAP